MRFPAATGSAIRAEKAGVSFRNLASPAKWLVSPSFADSVIAVS